MEYLVLTPIKNMVGEPTQMFLVLMTIYISVYIVKLILPFFNMRFKNTENDIAELKRELQLEREFVRENNKLLIEKLERLIDKMDATVSSNHKLNGDVIELRYRITKLEAHNNDREKQI